MVGFSNNGQGDEWSLIAAELDLAAISLEEALSFGEQGKDVPNGDRAFPYNRISIRLRQPTLMRELSYFRRKPKLTLSATERIVTKHGLLLLRENDILQHLHEVRGNWEQTSRLQPYDNDAVANATQNSSLSPTGLIPGGTTISMYSWVHSDVVDFANDASLHLQNAVIFCMLTSLATLEEKGGYHTIVVEDLARLNSWMANRVAYYEQMLVPIPA